MRNLDEINRLLVEAEEELAKLNSRRTELLQQITELKQEQALHGQIAPPQSTALPSVTNQSSQEAKISLFRSQFRGREDVYPKRFESLKTGKTGYQPVCRHEWVSGICEKPKIRCEKCIQREFLPVTDKAKYVTGLSATVVRKDGHHPIVFMQCGPARYRVDDRKQAEKRPFDHKVIIRPTNFHLPSYLENTPSLPIQDVYTTLVKDDERNQLIVEDVITAVKAKRFPVLLTERREHLNLLADLLAGHIQHVIVMAGGMGKKQRRQLLDQIANIPADQPRVIVATGRYLGEGFDDERLDTLFLALPISWQGTLTQYAGRLHRLNAAKKDVIIYDYVDFEVPVLAKMYTKRRTGYKGIGYEIVMPNSKSQTDQLELKGL